MRCLLGLARTPIASQRRPQPARRLRRPHVPGLGGHADTNEAASPYATQSDPVYRFWSPAFARHFYTISAAERDKLVTRYPEVWTCEGVAYQAFADDSHRGTVPVYRFWSETLQEHFFTTSAQEKAKLLETAADVWTSERIAFYCPATEGVSVFRFWSPTLSSHFLTISKAERDKLLGGLSNDWTYEGIAWCALIS